MRPASDEDSPRQAFNRLSSVTLAKYLTDLTFDDGKARWDANRGALRQCLHCASPDNVKRHLCVKCRTARTPFMLPIALAQLPNFATNPYVLAGGYRWCQRQCSGVPLPLTYFPKGGGKKCVRCSMARKRGLASGGVKVVARRPPAVSPAPKPRRHFEKAPAIVPAPNPSRRSTRVRKQRRVDTSPTPSFTSSPSPDGMSSYGSAQPAPPLTRQRSAQAFAPAPPSVQVIAPARVQAPQPVQVPQPVHTWSVRPCDGVPRPPPRLRPLVIAPTAASTAAVPPPSCAGVGGWGGLARPCELKTAWGPPTPTGDFPQLADVAVDPFPRAGHVRSRSLDDSKSTLHATPVYDACIDDTAADLLGDATPMGLAALDDLLESL